MYLLCIQISAKTEEIFQQLKSLDLVRTSGFPILLALNLLYVPNKDWKAHLEMFLIPLHTGWIIDQ